MPRKPATMRQRRALGVRHLGVHLRGYNVVNPGIRRALAAAGCALALNAIEPVLARASAGDEAQSTVPVDHYVVNESAVPAITGQKTQVYVRERVKPATVLRGGTPRVVLFVHGAGTPAEVAFDVPYADYSWMGYLAHAGFDVFSMDMTGYGRSTRPLAMNDPCNLTKEQQAGFVPVLIPGICAASYPRQMTTLASDWHDID